MLRPAVLAAALIALAAFSHAQTLRLAGRTDRVTAAADSAVKSVFEGGSARLMPEPPVDPEVQRYWLTKAERTRWQQTADLAETQRMVKQMEAGSRWIKVVNFGRTGQGRDLQLAILSKDRLFTPAEARAAGKVVVLIQNGIHAGEIEGKDASLMLLRDLAVLHRHDDLLDSVVVLVVPVFSADAHERRSPRHRLQQNGPEEQGWRHTPIGLNLNRDYLKADAPEMRALIGEVFTAWRPDVFVDNHTTDGADHQYDLTWATNHGAGMPDSLDRWVRTAFEGRIVPRLEGMGHIVGPYAEFREGADPFSGVEYGNSTPRYSTGYGPAQSRLALLVETHSLKPYGVRVKATYDLMMALLEELNARPRLLLGAVRAAEAEASARANAADPAQRTQVLATRVTDRATPYRWRGLETRWEKSEVTGVPVPRYTATPMDTVIPMYRETAPALTVTLPAGGYVVPQEWTEVTSRLALHGIRTRVLATAWSDSVERVRVTDKVLSPDNYEGRQSVKVVAVQRERQLGSFRAGDVWVPLDQPGGPLAVSMLEAQSPEGLLAWGFFSTIFQRKEYGADYMIDPMARAMMAADPRLATEFRARVAADSAFAANPMARAEWFYRRSPWADPEQDLHPVARALRRPPESVLVPLPGAARPTAPAPKR
jgi:hypothetical protein